VILVSHDVEEALYLCDRVVVLSPRPAKAVAELAWPGRRALPRERAVVDPAFVALREQALRSLREGRR
jgi:NitT/TauT family transport system ATP-binding protein